MYVYLVSPSLWPVCRMDKDSSFILSLRLSMRWMLTLLMKRTRYIPLLSPSSCLLQCFSLSFLLTFLCCLLIKNYYSLLYFCVFILWKCLFVTTCTVTLNDPAYMYTCIAASGWSFWLKLLLFSAHCTASACLYASPFLFLHWQAVLSTLDGLVLKTLWVLWPVIINVHTVVE